MFQQTGSDIVKAKKGKSHLTLQLMRGFFADQQPKNKSEIEETMSKILKKHTFSVDKAQLLKRKEKSLTSEKVKFRMLSMQV